MTHTLHRLIDATEGNQDWLLICKAANGINDFGAASKLRRFLYRALECGAINCGHGRGGGIHLRELDTILETVTDQSTVTALFDDSQKAAAFINDWQIMDMGLSVTLSARFDASMAMCQKLKITPHSIKHSLGIWGRTNRLPDKDVLKITTLCGHGLVSTSLVAKYINDVRNKRIAASEASKILARPCLCGIFNLTISTILLEKFASECRCNTEADK